MLGLTSSYICQKRLEYDKIIASCKRNRLCNWFQGINKPSKIIPILFYCVSVFKWPLYILSIAVLFVDKDSNRCNVMVMGFTNHMILTRDHSHDLLIYPQHVTYKLHSDIKSSLIPTSASLLMTTS